jgi:sugar O-acyltransferase (sialic acid O-acetyltransferase NeuD family)
MNTTIKQTMILLGGGGHAAVVADGARAAGIVVLGCLDDGSPESVSETTGEPGATGPIGNVTELKRMGAIADFDKVRAGHRHAAFHAAVGDPQLRKQWLDMVGILLTPTITHPSAIVSPSARLSDACFIGPRAVINARAVLGKGVIINTGAIVEHDCTLEPFCHLAPGSVLAGTVTVGENTLIGANATVIPGVRIGANCTVGAGAVVLNDVPANTTVVGVPAAPLAAVRK